MLSGSHWLSPSSAASGSPTHWVFCQLCQLFHWSCSWHQLAHCISLCTLFTEPTVGKAPAKSLEEDSRSCRIFMHVSSLLVYTAAITVFSRDDAAAIAVDTLYSLLSWLTQWTQPWWSSKSCHFIGGAHISLQHKIVHDQVTISWRTCTVL